MADLNSSFSNFIPLTDKAYVMAECDSAFMETSCSSVFSLDSMKVLEIASESSSDKYDAADISIDKCTSNWKVDSGILDSVINTSENMNLIDLNCTCEHFNQYSDGISSDLIDVVNDIEIHDKKFCKGSQVSNDPSFLSSFENSASSNNGKANSEHLDSATNILMTTNIFKCDDTVENFNQSSGVMASDIINAVNDVEIQDKEFLKGSTVSRDLSFLSSFENSASSSNGNANSEHLDSATNTLMTTNIFKCDDTVENFNQSSGVMALDFINAVNDIEIHDKEFCKGSQVSNDPSVFSSFENSVSLSNGKANSEHLDSSTNTLRNNNIFKCDDTVENFKSSGVMASDIINAVNDVEIQNKEYLKGSEVFNDPSFLNFFENLTSSNNVSESLIYRSSLYQKFDPLFAKNLPKSNINSAEIRETAKETDFQHDNQGTILSSDNLREKNTDKSQIDVKFVEEESNEIKNGDCNAATANNVVPPALIKPNFSTSSPPYLENNLISFDLPLINDIGSNLESGASCSSVSDKTFSEEELNQALKLQECLLKVKYTSKQQELEEIFSKRQKNFDEELKQRKLLSIELSMVIKEIVTIAFLLYDKVTSLKNKLQLIETENKELNIELNKSSEDLQNIENAVSCIYKRYEQCKKLLKMCIENEKNLVQQLEFCVKEKTKYEQSGIPEQFDRYNAELSMKKKSLDDNIEELKAKLQQAELEISNVEMNLKLAKTENETLNFKCDDLMSKIHKT